MRSISSATAVLMSLTAASAAVVSSCTGSSNDVCFQWAVPQSSKDALFQIQAPDTYQWVALGIGTSMSNSKMFIVYKDGSGNVTLSPREASGHVEPDYVQTDGVSLMDGSGVTNGKMTANVRCSDCSGLDTSGSSQWIAAWRSGGSLSSTSMNADISMHNGNDAFGVDLSKASVTTSSSTNPFTQSQSTNGQDNSSGSSNGAVTSEGSGGSDTIVALHGIFMAAAFAVLYPLGALLMPLVSKWWLHGAVQFIGFVVMWVGFGLGYYYADRRGDFWGDYHQQIGVIVVALLGIQPILGWLHHHLYKRKGRRTFISHIHIWYGRILLLLGLINGGFGLALQPASNGQKIAYAIVAGVFGGLYVGAAIWGTIKRHREPRPRAINISSRKRARETSYSPDGSEESNLHYPPHHESRS